MNVKNYRESLKDKKRIVIKIGSSSLIHQETGELDLYKLEKLVRALKDLKNRGKDVILVSSGAIAVGKSSLNLRGRKLTLTEKEACAALGQAQLMTIYQKLFAEYGQLSAQVLMTKYTILDDLSRYNARNTLEELLKLNVIPVVNENDTVSTYEIEFGDNDRLSALVCALIKADLLILLSDIDGLYTDDPNINSDAKMISVVEKIDKKMYHMSKSTSTSDVGTGGMTAKITAAEISTHSGADMVIANGADPDVIEAITTGKEIGTLFLADEKEAFEITNYLKD